jgi:ABC-type dipeptide/oligopeptide/nickel transport system permease component
VAAEVFRAVGNTLLLAAVATVIGFFLGGLFGFVAGYFSNSWIDKAASAVAVLGVSVPHYWLGMVLVIIFSAQLGWLPATGAGPGGAAAWRWDWAHAQFLVLPALTLSVIPMGIIARTVRALVADILAQDFVTGLRAKGLGDLGVFFHVVKNAAPTALAVMGLQLGYLLGGSILIETVFSWPGTGYLSTPPSSSAICRCSRHDPGPGPLLRSPQSRGRRDADLARPPHPEELTPMASLPMQAGDELGAPVKATGYWATVWQQLRRDRSPSAPARSSSSSSSWRSSPPGWRPRPDPGSMLNRLNPSAPRATPWAPTSSPRHALEAHLGARLSLLMGVTPVVFAFFIGTAHRHRRGPTRAASPIPSSCARSTSPTPSRPCSWPRPSRVRWGAGFGNALISLTVVFVPPIARIAESVTTQLRSRDFVEAARASGAGAITIVRVHVLGNVLGPIFVYATSLISVSMILASGLSFLASASARRHPNGGSC